MLQNKFKSRQIIQRFNDWVKKQKKTKINSVNDNGKCFQYAVTVTLNY